jgi:cytochrome c oxidase accessory protein FixG
MVAWWTGGAWVLYFADAPTLVKSLATFEAPAVAYVWIGILTFTTYALAGHMREQVCLYMCPWPRIQAALTDEEAIAVTYRYDRGEPRGSIKKNLLLRDQGLPAGDCIDCRQCVQVCPGGVDIRDGAQLGCFQCGLCIDACDAVMTKIGRPPRLIAYDTDLNIQRRQRGEPTSFRFVRARTVLYAAIIAVVGGLLLYTLVTRQAQGLSVLHDRNPLAVLLADGAVRNGYTLRILNKELREREFTLTVQGLNEASLDVVGITPRADGRIVVAVGPDQSRELRALVTARRDIPPVMTDISFLAVDTQSGERAQAPDHFHPFERH